MINFFTSSSYEPSRSLLNPGVFFWLNFFRNPSSGRKIFTFSDKRDPAGFSSYFLKLQKLFRPPAMSLARWLNVTWNLFKPQVPSDLYKTCSADGHTRVSVRDSSWRVCIAESGPNTTRRSEVALPCRRRCLCDPVTLPDLCLHSTTRYTLTDYGI